MLCPRNVLRMIAAKNDIPVFNNCKNYGSEPPTGFKKILKNVDIPNLLRYRQNIFKYSDRQIFFKDEIYKARSQLKDLLIKENNSYIDASFIFKVDPVAEDKVNDEIRDFEIEKLCDLNRVFFQLPVNVICDTVSFVDRFISKVKVKPKYMSCLTAACFHLSASSKGYNKIFLSLDNLANLLRCGASGYDLEHMQQIVKKKLNDSIPIVTIFNFIEELDPEAAKDRQLIHVLHSALSKFLICWHRPSRVAIAVLVNYYQNLKQHHMIEGLCDLFKFDWDEINLLGIRITEQCQNSPSIRLGTQGRDQLLWIISRKTLSSIHIASTPELETIAEEVDDMCSVL